MSLRKDDISSAFVQWARANTGYVTIVLDQDGVKPQTPFISVKVIAGPTRMGSTDESYYDRNANFVIVGRREATVSVQAYGCNAFDILNDLTFSFSIPDVQDFFQEQNIGIVNEGTPTDLTGLLDTEHEERAQMDVRIYVQDVRSVTVGIIETVDVTGDVDSGKQIIDTQFHIEST